MNKISGMLSHVPKAWPISRKKPGTGQTGNLQQSSVYKASIAMPVTFPAYLNWVNVASLKNLYTTDTVYEAATWTGQYTIDMLGNGLRIQATPFSFSPSFSFLSPGGTHKPKRGLQADMLQRRMRNLSSKLQESTGISQQQTLPVVCKNYSIALKRQRQHYLQQNSIKRKAAEKEASAQIAGAVTSL